VKVQTGRQGNNQRRTASDGRQHPEILLFDDAQLLLTLQTLLCKLAAGIRDEYDQAQIPVFFTSFNQLFSIRPIRMNFVSQKSKMAQSVRRTRVQSAPAVRKNAEHCGWSYRTGLEAHRSGPINTAQILSGDKSAFIRQAVRLL
jgi:hypothetical protein